MSPTMSSLAYLIPILLSIVVTSASVYSSKGFVVS